MRRKQATKLLDAIRVIVARAEAGDLCENTATELIGIELAEAGLAPLEACGGEAHSNAFIDNCMRCAPRWGWVGAVEVVR